ncbi:NADAR family protein [Nocardioides rubriscoriae]|uniref:NADAR family protein n=1 Tax=Nocardioides rubriscoriae TaxID=642762 RepID=UPI001FED2300|nr:NADAR family protein [Nocardioides rubriscoriae]
MIDPAQQLQSLVERERAGESLELTFFWTHESDDHTTVGRECFSQWWVAPFDVDGRTYLTAEHWMMAEKARVFGDRESESAVLGVASPAEAKALGRGVRGFDSAVWAEHRFDVVVRGNAAKFAQHPALGRVLDGTGDSTLVEASPDDLIWGIGFAEDDPAAASPRAWRGLNLLGFALVQARAVLRGR